MGGVNVTVYTTKKKKKKKEVPGNLVPFFLLSLVLGPNENMADFYCNLDKNVLAAPPHPSSPSTPPPSPTFNLLWGE